MTDFLSSLSTFPSWPPPRIRWIKWHPPDAAYKLNRESSALENRGASIIRDSCAHYGLGRNLIAETKALLPGLELARSFPIPLSSIEVDSQNVIHFIKSDKCPGHSVYLLRASKGLIHRSSSLSQSLRQANRVADSLASKLISTKVKTFSYPQGSWCSIQSRCR
jgi:hypothetical protein